MGEKTRAESHARASMSMSWVTLAIVVVIGLFALLSLYMGFQAFGSDNPEQSTYYIIIGTAGFAVIGYMFFRTKAVTTSKKSIVPVVEVVTILECQSCNLKRVRDFRRGDFIYKDDEPCTRCDGNMLVTGIHRKANAKAKAKMKT